MIAFDIPGLAVHSADARRTTYGLADGSRLTIANPPTGPDGQCANEISEAAAPVRAALKALGVVENEAAMAAEDATLSELGREEKLQPLLEAALAALDQAGDELARVEGLAAAIEAKVFAPPKLTAGDYEAALIDQEIRAYLRGINEPTERRSALEAIEANPRYLAAVLRSPAPMRPFSDHAASIWRRQAEAQNPEARSAARYRAGLEWARATTPHIRARIEARARRAAP